MKILNFINSINNYIDSGMLNVSDEIFINRISICKRCDKFDKDLNRCLECGCFLYIKARWSTEKCPLDKWDPEVATEQNQETTPPQTQNSTEKPGGCGCGK